MAFFYLSQVLGRPVSNDRGDRIARIKDLVARIEVAQENDVRLESYPPVSGLVVRIEGQDVFVPWTQVASLDPGGAHLASAKIDLRGFERREGEVLLARDILDKQLIDIDGRQVIRANDLQLFGVDFREASGRGASEGHAEMVRVVAVDVSGQALVRRFTFGRLFANVAPGTPPKQDAARERRRRRMGPMEMIHWPDIEPLQTGMKGVRLRLPHDRLALLNPVDLAHIIDDLSYVRGTEIIESLDDEIAADTLQEIDEERQADIIEGMDQERAADILEEMEPDDAADLLADLAEEQALDLLRRMDRDQAEDVEELLRYPQTSAGGIMTSAFVTVPARFTVEETIEFMRCLEDTPAVIDYLYVVEEISPGTDWAHVEQEGGAKLLGIVSLRDLLLSAAERKLSDLMVADFVWVRPDDPWKKAARLMSRYNLVALPVLDELEGILGIITVDDVMEVVLPERERRRLPRIFG